MSERKTAEIKIRVTPTEKASWQAEADSKGVPLSELIRERMNIVERTKRAMEEEGIPIGRLVGPLELMTAPVDLTEQESTVEPLESPVRIVSDELYEIAAAPQEDVPTSDEVGANCERGCKPWEFCACKARSFEDGVTR